MSSSWEDQVLLAVELDLGAGVFAEQHPRRTPLDTLFSVVALVHRVSTRNGAHPSARRPGPVPVPVPRVALRRSHQPTTAAAQRRRSTVVYYQNSASPGRNLACA